MSTSVGSAPGRLDLLGGVADYSGALVLETRGSAEARGAPILARLAGYGSATDAHHMTAPEPGGRGARAAMQQAGLANLDWVCAHGTATPLNDAMEAGVMASLLPGVPFSSVKGAIGHTLGAAGAIELVITVLAVHQGCLPPNVGCAEPEFDVELVQQTRTADVRAALSVNFAFGGHNAAVRIERC